MEEQKRNLFPKEEGRENTEGDSPDISQPAGTEEINPAEPTDGMQVHGTDQQQFGSCPAGEAAPDQPVNQSIPYQSGQSFANGQYNSSQPSWPGQPGPNQQFTGQPYGSQPGPNQQFTGQPYGSQPGQPPLQNGFPGQYIQPQYGARPPQTQDSGGMAIASMVLGIVSIVLCTLYFLAPICAVVGLVLGCIYKSKGGKSGLATAGIICSSIGLAIGVILICVIILGIGLSAYY